jgi:hypothetical protein
MNLGLPHFLLLDSEMANSKNQDQDLFIKKDLELFTVAIKKKKTKNDEPEVETMTWISNSKTKPMEVWCEKFLSEKINVTWEKVIAFPHGVTDDTCEMWKQKLGYQEHHIPRCFPHKNVCKLVSQMVRIGDDSFVELASKLTFMEFD